MRAGVPVGAPPIIVKESPGRQYTEGQGCLPLPFAVLRAWGGAQCPWWWGGGCQPAVCLGWSRATAGEAEQLLPRLQVQLCVGEGMHLP